MAKPFNDVRFHRAHIAFTKALGVSSINDDEFHERIKDKADAWYCWQGTTKPVVEGRKGRCQDMLQEFLTMEDFYLNKQLFTAGREYISVNRYGFGPRYDLRIFTPSSMILFDGDIDVIVSLYSLVRVVTIALVMRLTDVGLDDLVFLKGLKWYSIEPFGGNRFFEIVSAVEGQRELTTLQGVFERIWSDIGQGMVVDSETECWLDSIEVQGPSRPLSDVELFGLITGDEGYRLILDPEREATDVPYVKRILDNPVLRMQGRSYFTYNFATTSVLGRMADNYPSGKKAFAREYAKKYGQVEPLSDYIALDTKIPTLADGIYFVCEIALARYLLYKQLDEKIRKALSAGVAQPPSLRSLLELKKKVVSRLLDMELLTKDFLWLHIMGFASKMFGIDILKDHIDDRVKLLESYVLAAYNRNIDRRIIRLTIVTAILTLLTFLTGLSGLARIWDWVLSFWR